MTDVATASPLDDRRAAVAQSTVVVAASALCQLVFLWIGRRAGTPWPWLLVAAGSAFGGLLLLNLLIRSGWSERFEDPSLSQAHIQYGTLSMAIAYPLMGWYGCLVLPLAVALLTFGVFTLRGRQFTGLALWALGTLGAGMAVAVFVWPGNVPWDLALGQFLALCIAMPSIAWFAARISVLRHRLGQQRTELRKALVRIEHLATRDALTGLANRRHAETVVDQTLRRQRRGGRPAALATKLSVSPFLPDSPPARPVTPPRAGWTAPTARCTKPKPLVATAPYWYEPAAFRRVSKVGCVQPRLPICLPHA